MYGYVFQNINGRSHGNIEELVVPLERNLNGNPLAGLLWKRQFEKALMELGWEKSTNDILMVGKKHNLAPMRKNWMKDVDIEELISFLDERLFRVHST